MVIITNSTYDGLVYDVTKIVTKLSPIADVIHFDEAYVIFQIFLSDLRREREGEEQEHDFERESELRGETIN